MAEIKFILQAVTSANHAEEIQSLLKIPEPNQILVSIAFVCKSGLAIVEAAITPLAKKAKFFVGIRNDITSIQAIKLLLKMNVELYAVDTGSRNTIFHPKLYFSANEKQAIVIIGSANLTFGGLRNNIEASTIMRLDLSDPADKKFADEATNAFIEMLDEHPQHVFLIKDDKHADEIFESGRLADETVILAPSTISSVKRGERDDLPPMNLHKVVPLHMKSLAVKPKPVVAEKPVKAVLVKPAPVAETPQAVAVAPKYLVWESKKLSRRTLNIPTGTNTNRTGSIGLGKGSMTGFDHRRYFRDVVFAGLDWIPDNPPSTLESVRARFELVIKNLNYGFFEMTIRHNTDTTSISYDQRNEMTHLRWGNVISLVAKDDLLDRKLYLYRKDTDPPEFMIEID